MMETLPEGFFENEKARVLDPTCGKGNMVIAMYERFMTNLKLKIPDEDERHKHVVENIIHFADMNRMNIRIVELFLNRGEK